MAKKLEELKVTPGEWRFQVEGDSRCNCRHGIVATSDGRIVAMCMGGDEERIDADARMMAASTAMYVALLPFVSLMDWMLNNAAQLGVSDMVLRIREHGDRAKKALAKAAGEVV